MPDDNAITLAIVLGLWALTMVQGTASLRDGLRFYRFVRHALQRPTTGAYRPPATVILPCCGVDDRLADTVDALHHLNYSDYEVLFVFESADDPAYAVIGRCVAHWKDRPWQRVVAGPAENRSQKVHNLLAAVTRAAPDRRVLAFLDSDAVPHADWLAHLVEPLHDPAVGAATGFRWYAARGGWINGIRSAWNAASVSFLHDDKHNFCWGGSTAIRRDAFERCDIARHWHGALSDDYQVTRAVREAGLAIRFVPQCLISCHESTNFRQFLVFARRQLVITRVCAPRLWWAGLTLAAGFVVAATATFLLAVVSALRGDAFTAVVSGAAWIVLLLLAKTKAIVRQAAVAHALRPPQWTWRDWAYDVMGSEVVGVLYLLLLLASARSRRIVWRDRVYQMLSPDETRTLAPARRAARAHDLPRPMPP